MATNGKNIYQQIESSGDFYAPAIYDLLTFHNSMFETEPDPLANDYIPLTSFKLPDRTKVLPFVIGLLPPSNAVTGKLLDRSASVASDEKGGFAADWPKITAPAVLFSGRVPDGATVVPANATRLTGTQAKNALVQGWKSVFGSEPSANVWPILMAQWALETGRGEKMMNYNFGGIKGAGPDNLTAGYETSEFYSDGHGGTKRVNIIDYFRAYTDANQGAKDYVALLRKRYPEAVAAMSEGDVNGFVHGLKERRYFTAPEAEYAAGVNSLVKEAQTNGPGKLGSDGTIGPPQEPPKKIEGDAGTKTDFAIKGSAAAKTAAKADQAKAGKDLTGVDLNKSKLGQKFTAAQKNLIRALQIAIQQMANTPPMRMMINPESFKVASLKIISDGNWGRNGAGAGIEHWGDGQDTISASGRIAGFYALDSEASANGSPGNSPGLTRMARNFSGSYQNFLSLYLLYRNNGGVWLEDFADAQDAKTTKPNNLALVGSVYLYYDNTMYIGSFDSFSITEDDTAPFTLSYSFEFVVRTSYLLDRLGNDNPNPNTDYGMSGIFGPTVNPTANAGPTVAPLAGGAVAPPPGGVTIDPSNKPSPLATQPTGGVDSADAADLFAPGGLQLSAPQSIQTKADVIPLGGYGGWTPKLP